MCVCVCVCVCFIHPFILTHLSMSYRLVFFSCFYLFVLKYTSGGGGEREGRRGGESERERKFQASRLCVVRCEPGAGLDPRNREITI